MAQNDKQTDGHGDSMTDPAQRAESVKTIKTNILQKHHEDPECYDNFFSFLFRLVPKQPSLLV